MCSEIQVTSISCFCHEAITKGMSSFRFCLSANKFVLRVCCRVTALTELKSSGQFFVRVRVDGHNGIPLNSASTYDNHVFPVMLSARMHSWPSSGVV